MEAALCMVIRPGTSCCSRRTEEVMQDVNLIWSRAVKASLEGIRRGGMPGLAHVEADRSHLQGASESCLTVVTP